MSGVASCGSCCLCLKYLEQSHHYEEPASIRPSFHCWFRLVIRISYILRVCVDVALAIAPFEEDYIGMQFETEFPMSTGAANILRNVSNVLYDGSSRGSYFLPASVAQQQQSSDAGQQKIWMNISFQYVYTMNIPVDLLHMLQS